MQTQRQEETFLLSHYQKLMKCMVDLRSGYYHISLKSGSKAKTAFVTPFGKYQFEAVPFSQAQNSSLLSTIDFYGVTGFQ